MKLKTAKTMRNRAEERKGQRSYLQSINSSLNSERSKKKCRISVNDQGIKVYLLFPHPTTPLPPPPPTPNSQIFIDLLILPELVHWCNTGKGYDGIATESWNSHLWPLVPWQTRLHTLKPCPEEVFTLPCCSVTDYSFYPKVLWSPKRKRQMVDGSQGR